MLQPHGCICFLQLTLETSTISGGSTLNREESRPPMQKLVGWLSSKGTTGNINVRKLPQAKPVFQASDWLDCGQLRVFEKCHRLCLDVCFKAGCCRNKWGSRASWGKRSSGLLVPFLFLCTAWIAAHARQLEWVRVGRKTVKLTSDLALAVHTVNQRGWQFWFYRESDISKWRIQAGWWRVWIYCWVSQTRLNVRHSPKGV